MSDLTSLVSHQLSIYLFNQDNTVLKYAPNLPVHCSSTSASSYFNCTLEKKKSSVLCPYSSAQTLILERDMFYTVESAARGARNGWLQLAGAEHWTRILNVRVHADLRSGKRRKPNYHPIGCSGRMPPTACSGAGCCLVAWITSTAKWVEDVGMSERGGNVPLSRHVACATVVLTCGILMQRWWWLEIPVLRATKGRTAVHRITDSLHPRGKTGKNSEKTHGDRKGRKYMWYKVFVVLYIQWKCT